jgi:hypothetical protein
MELFISVCIVVVVVMDPRVAFKKKKKKALYVRVTNFMAFKFKLDGPSPLCMYQLDKSNQSNTALFTIITESTGDALFN